MPPTRNRGRNNRNNDRNRGRRNFGRPNYGRQQSNNNNNNNSNRRFDFATPIAIATDLSIKDLSSVQIQGPNGKLIRTRRATSDNRPIRGSNESSRKGNHGKRRRSRSVRQSPSNAAHLSNNPRPVLRPTTLPLDHIDAIEDCRSNCSTSNNGLFNDQQRRRQPAIGDRPPS